MLRRLSLATLLATLLLAGFQPMAENSARAQTGSPAEYIAFVSGTGGTPALVVMRADGMDQRRLVDIAPDETPAWSPDGTQIAYVRALESGARELAVIDVEGQRARVLTDLGGTISHPVWSPAGDRIAFAAALNGPADVYTILPDGTDPINVTAHPADDRWPSWNPDGTRLAFQSERDGASDIYTIGSDGSDLLRLTADPAADVAPVWSPEGLRVAFLSDRDGNANIFAVDFNGTNLVRLSETPLDDSGPVWSPDGVFVAYAGAIADGITELFVINADGIELRQITIDNAEVETPAWSPDGARLVYASNRGGTFDLYTLDASGSGWTALTSDPASNLTRPAWIAVAHEPVADLPADASPAPSNTPTLTVVAALPLVTATAALLPLPTVTPAPPVIIATATPPPTLAPPTLTPVPAPDLTLIYDPALPAFYLVNTSGRRINLAGVSFSGGGREVSASVWMTASMSASLFDFPVGGCLGLWGLGVPVQPVPSECARRHSWWESDSYVFWAGEQFAVLNGGLPVAVCYRIDGRCAVDLSGPAVALPPTAAPPLAPQPTQAADVLLVYDSALPALYLVNTAARPLDLSRLLFEGGGRVFSPEVWASVMTGSVYSFSAGDCLGVWGLGVPRQSPPPECETRQGWMESDRWVFWAGDSFTVRYDGTALATCTSQAGRCAIVLP